MVAAADAASDVRARVVRIWARSPAKVFRSWARGPIRPWSGPRSTVDQGDVGGRRQRGELSQGGDAVRPSGVGQAKQCLGPVDRDGARPGDLFGRSREVLHRTQLSPRDGKDVDRPEQGRRQQAVGRTEAADCRVEGRERRPRQDAVGREPLLGRLHRRLTLPDVARGQHQDDGDRRRPEHHDRHHGDDDLRAAVKRPASAPRPEARRTSGRPPRRSVPPARRFPPGERTASLFVAGPRRCALGVYLTGVSHPWCSLESLRNRGNGFLIVRPLSPGTQHCDFWLCTCRADSLE